MCGIFAIVSNDNHAPEITFKSLSDIEYRGYDSWGIAYWNMEDGRWKIEKNIGFLPSNFNFIPSSISFDNFEFSFL